MRFGQLYQYRHFFLWPLVDQVGNVVTVEDDLIMPVRWAEPSDWHPEVWLNKTELAICYHAYVIVLHRGCLRVARVASLTTPDYKRLLK